MDPTVAARIKLVRGDITTLKVDAIVNAANSSLRGGGGVDGTIHRAAGPELLAECRTLGGCPTGSAKITRGYRLPVRYVIHAVGPVYSGGGRGEAELLASCYRESLRLAAEHRCETMAFPAISCGVYGYPLEEAARVSLEAVGECLARSEFPREVTWCLFEPRAYDAYAKALTAAIG
jgi:O-acetyl-ADP-ribose deacetylase (regulator of RNase III)